MSTTVPHSIVLTLTASAATEAAIGGWGRCLFACCTATRSAALTSSGPIVPITLNRSRMVAQNCSTPHHQHRCAPPAVNPSFAMFRDRLGLMHFNWVRGIRMWQGSPKLYDAWRVPQLQLCDEQLFSRSCFCTVVLFDLGNDHPAAMASGATAT
jgi:hypothetical protein